MARPPTLSRFGLPLTADERKAAVRFYASVNEAHVFDGGGEGAAGARVVLDVGGRERALAAVCEPFVRDLIAADVEVPE